MLFKTEFDRDERGTCAKVLASTDGGETWCLAGLTYRFGFLGGLRARLAAAAMRSNYEASVK